jgi:CSLREA domain-containing protein
MGGPVERVPQGRDADVVCAPEPERRCTARAVLLLACIQFALFAASASGAEFKVNSSADATGCAATCSLRGAIEAADASGDAANTVVVPAGTYTLLPAETANPDHVGQLRLTNGAGTTLKVIGAGEDSTIVNAAKGDRVMRVSGGGVDVLRGMTFEGGYPSEMDSTLNESARGGGVLQIGGTLALEGMRLTEDEDGGWGGGVDVGSHGVLELLESELDHDQGFDAGGGGVSLEPGTLVATNSSLVYDNAPASTGGAVQLLAGSSASFINDTLANDGVSGSGDTYEGGAVFLEAATAAFTNVTFSDDAALGNTHGGADISANEGSHLTFQNVLLGGPVGGEGEEQACNERFNGTLSTWTDLGGNLAADTTCNLAASDMGVALGLGELSFNGGLTQTVPLLAGSLAINHGVTGCPASDQRGYARVGQCDSGAYEFAASAPEEKKTAVIEPEPVKHEAAGPSAEAVERLLLGCGTAKLVLSDVYTRGGHVVIRGSAAKTLIGKRVKILLNGTRQVAAAVVKADGQYATSAPLPVLHGHVSLAARYVAETGKLRSLNLKLTRRLKLEAPVLAGDEVTLSGQVLPPLTRPIAPVVLEQELECGKPTVLKRFTPPRSGRYRVTVSVPAGTSAAVFRLKSSVAADARSVKHGFATFSLPLPVVIGAG